MNIIVSTLNQIAFLFGFITIGFFLVKSGVTTKDSSAVLAKLENTIFIPALVMGTFIENFTIKRISSAWKLLLISFIIEFIVLPIAILIPKIITKDNYIRNIYTYGFAFSNFGFMGNAVVKSLFPEIFFEYLIFTLPLWTIIYLWGVPRLLIADSGTKHSFKENLKSFVNPMFIGMIIGMIIGLLNIKLPTFITTIISVSGDCMSPIAMILTGMVVSSISLKDTFSNVKIYIVSIIRLIIFPLLFIIVTSFLHLPKVTYLCALCSLSMPLGLNTIVVPSALGKDTSVAAGMTVISHILSCITIPIVFAII